MKALLFIISTCCVLPNLHTDAAAKIRQLYISSGNLIEKVEGSKVEVRCWANRDVPTRYIFWKAQQRNSHFEQHHPNNYTVVFTITDLHRSDAGLYKCILVDAEGNGYMEKKMVLHVTPNASHPDSRGKCGITQFRCVDSDVCIFTRFLCDGQPNCPDNSDEINCSKDICRDKFRCNNSRCINKRLVCDGTDHCSDGTDEENCFSTVSTMTPDVDETYHFNWLKTTVYTVIGCTVAIVIFISFIVIVVFRIKMKHLRARRLARALERHRQHQDGAAHPSRAAEQDPFLSVGTNSHFGNIIVNVNNGVQFVPSQDFTQFVDNPPPYHEVVGAERRDSPPPPYSTIDRSQRPKSLSETAAETGNPASSRRDVQDLPLTETNNTTETVSSITPVTQASDSEARNHTTQSLPRVDSTSQGQPQSIESGAEQSTPVQCSHSLPRPGRLAVHDGKIVINPEHLDVAGSTSVSSNTLDTPRQGQLEVKEGQIVLKLDGAGDEALTRQMRGIQSPLEGEGSQSAGGGTLDVQDGVIVFRPRES